MIQHIWTVICSNSVIDQDSNNISLQSVIEQLNIAGTPPASGVVPAVPISLEVVTLWARADFDVPGRGRARVTFLFPSGIPSAPLQFEYGIDLSSFKRNRTRWHINGLPIRESGRHIFRVEFQNEGENVWREVATVPLEVIVELTGSEQTGSGSTA